MTQINKAFDKEEYEELEVRTKALLVFAESNPEDLIRYQKRATGDRRYLILDLIQQYISEKQATSRTGYLNTLHSSLRSFFLHNRCELPRDSSFKIRGKKSPVTGALNVEIIKDILRHCNAVRARIIENMLHVVLCNYKIIYSMVP